MSTSDLAQEKSRREQELKILRQIAFASGLFQGDVTVRTLLESLAEGVVIIDSTGTILLVNTAAEKMFGYPREELIGKPHAVLIPERFRKVHEEHEADFFKEPKIRPMGQLLDLAARRRDGSEFPVEISLGFVETINGVLVLAMVSDMTLRKQYESRLRDSEELFRIQVECVKDYAIFMLDAEGNVLNWNAGAERLTGYRDEEIIGRHFSCFFPEEDRDGGKPAAELEKAAAGERSECEGWRLRKDGSRFWAEDVVTALRDESGNLRGFSRVTHDITERRRAEEALREYEARYRTLFDSIDEGFCIIEMIFDENGKPIDYRFLETNPSFEKQTGLIDALGRRMRELAPEHEEHWFEMYGRIALTGEPARFQNRAEQLHRWFDVYAFRFGQPENRQVAILFNDITERKRSEDALRFSEARYRALFHDNPTMIFTLDAEGTILSANPFSASQLGYTVDELEGQPMLTVFHEDDRSALAGQLRNCMENPGQVHFWQLRKIRKDGGLLWVDETAQAVYDLNGALNILIVCLDITERKRAEEALRESEQRFASFMLNLPAAAWMKDLHGRYVYVNAEAERIFSMPLSALLDKTDAEVFPPETARQFRQNDERVLVEGGSLQTNEVLRQADGIEHHSIVSKFTVPGLDGQPAYVAGVALDITDRKHAEEELRKSELKLSKIFHAVPALIGITTVDEGRCIDINETGLRTLGYRREEVVGRTMLELGVWESKSARDRLIRVLEENGMVRDQEINFRRRDGKMFTGLFSAELVDFNGNRYMLSIVNDITERKQMEEQIERLNTDLAARAFGLEVANRELEAFNYTVAHDLRKPLTVVNGYCQALGELCGDRLDEACRGYLRDAYDGTLRMNRLIDALLNFSQLAHVELRRESVDLSSLAHEVAAELQLSEPERRVTFRIAEGAVVNVDANLLRVVLDNLLGNAWKYTGMREEAVIEFGVTRFGGKTAFFVRDNGAGFAMADAEKLFVPFQRLPGAEGFKGFGIGLATVARIIERHGGRLWAEGEPDNGAIFYFTL